MGGVYLLVICHVASILEFMAFWQHDMVRLRLFEVASMFLMGIYSYLHDDVPIYENCHLLWSVLHFTVNSWRLLLLAHAHFSLKLTDEECTLLKGLFSIFNTTEFAALKKHFQWDTLCIGHEMIGVGNAVDRLYLVMSGTLAVRDLNGKHLASVNTDELGPQFIGELSFFTGQNASASVVVQSQKVRTVSWNMNTVRRFSIMEGHSVDAGAFRQLPSLFSVQIAKRMIQNDQSRHKEGGGKEINTREAHRRSMRPLSTKMKAFLRLTRPKVGVSELPHLCQESQVGLGNTKQQNEGEGVIGSTYLQWLSSLQMSQLQAIEDAFKDDQKKKQFQTTLSSLLHHKAQNPPGLPGPPGLSGRDTQANEVGTSANIVHTNRNRHPPEPKTHSFSHNQGASTPTSPIQRRRVHAGGAVNDNASPRNSLYFCV